MWFVIIKAVAIGAVALISLAILRRMFVSVKTFKWVAILILAGAFILIIGTLTGIY